MMIDNQNTVLFVFNIEGIWLQNEIELFLVGIRNAILRNVVILNAWVGLGWVTTIIRGGKFRDDQILSNSDIQPT
jgi:hypothetical protein